MRKLAMELQVLSFWASQRISITLETSINPWYSAGEILAQSVPQLERNIHPVVIISAFNKALKEALSIITSISKPIDVSSETEMLALIKTSIGTKFVYRWSDLMCKLALQAVRTVAQDDGAMKTVDIKRYARVEKVPGGEIEMSRVLDGVMLNKDVTHPKMRRRIVNPRIILLDCPLEYKKGESQTNSTLYILLLNVMCCPNLP
jgi:T-complex protein 1 subunit gamma